MLKRLRIRKKRNETRRILITTITSIYHHRPPPPSLSRPTPLLKLQPSSAIIITGFVPKTSVRFAINLACRTPGNLALHFNPRLDRGYVVRNTRLRGNWEEEETSSPPLSKGHIFQRKAYFHLLIFCGLHEFQIAINGEHFCSFNYRIPLEEITCVEILGDVEDVRSRQTNLFVYPDPEICKFDRNLEMKVDSALDNDLSVPLLIGLKDEFQVGNRIVIHGRLKLLPYSFYLNLQRGKTIHPHPVIALHLNPRFHYGSRPACVVMNSWNNGKWGPEERHEGHLNWMPGRDFVLMVRCESTGFSIWLENKMIGEFRHRLDPVLVDSLKITGDLVIRQIALSHS